MGKKMKSDIGAFKPSMVQRWQDMEAGVNMLDDLKCLALFGEGLALYVNSSGQWEATIVAHGARYVSTPELSPPMAVASLLAKVQAPESKPEQMDLYTGGL